ncbi:MAG: GntR family transcriptional regulator [Firmicutes bacterium]|nr:GntR family transcriptional regulator [Bacillota bacterium]
MSRYYAEIGRYEQIAIDIANKIVRKELKEGDKLSGRSTLAGAYNVSPETVRRAVALLQSKGVVEALVGKGIIIRSRTAAERFLKDFETKRVIEEIQARIAQLTAERDRINEEIAHELSMLVNYTSKAITRMDMIDEIRIPEDSWVVGQTIESSGINAFHDTLIIAIEKNDDNIFSPDASTKLFANDLLIIASPPGARERIRKIIERTKTQE